MLRTDQNSGVKHVQQRAIAEKEGQAFGLVLLSGINPKLLRLLKNNPLNMGSDSAVSAENARGRGYAYVGSGSNLPESYLAFFGCVSFIW